MGSGGAVGRRVGEARDGKRRDGEWRSGKRRGSEWWGGGRRRRALPAALTSALAPHFTAPHPHQHPNHTLGSPFGVNKDDFYKGAIGPWLSYSSNDPNTSLPLRYLDTFFNASTTAPYVEYFSYLRTLPWYGVMGNHEYGYYQVLPCATQIVGYEDNDKVCQCRKELGFGLRNVSFAEMISSPDKCQWSPLFEVDTSPVCPWNEGLYNTIPGRWHLRQGAWKMPVDVPSVGGNPLVDFVAIDTNPFIHECAGG